MPPQHQLRADRARRRREDDPGRRAAARSGSHEPLGRVDDGTSFMNWLPEEKERRTSISTSVCSLRARRRRVHHARRPRRRELRAASCAERARRGRRRGARAVRTGRREGRHRTRYRCAREHGLGLAAASPTSSTSSAPTTMRVAKQLEEALEVRVGEAAPAARTRREVLGLREPARRGLAHRDARTARSRSARRRPTRPTRSRRRASP